MIDVFKALSDENRLRIVNLLIKDSLCVCEIETLLNMSQSNVSRHLTKLRTANIIDSFKQQQWVYYGVSDQFKELNSLLFSYIKSKLIENEIFRSDDEIYKKYKENNFDCNSISENKVVVIDLIYQEGKNE